jgi:hypothetical protein
VGSFSIFPIGTYAASSNFHQPRDTTGIAVADHKSPVGFVQRHREVGLCTGQAPARHLPALGPIDDRDLMRVWHIDEDPRPAALELKGLLRPTVL